MENSWRFLSGLRQDYKVVSSEGRRMPWRSLSLESSFHSITTQLSREHALRQNLHASVGWRELLESIPIDRMKEISLGNGRSQQTYQLFLWETIAGMTLQRCPEMGWGRWVFLLWQQQVIRCELLPEGSVTFGWIFLQPSSELKKVLAEMCSPPAFQATGGRNTAVWNGDIWVAHLSITCLS